MRSPHGNVWNPPVLTASASGCVRATTPYTAATNVPAVREYRGLMEVAGMIARHPDDAGKRDVVEECVEEIVERDHEGRLTPFHGDALLTILSTGLVRVA